MFGRFFGDRFYAPRYFGNGGALAPEPEPEAEEFHSGGWVRAFRDESESERRARIHAERVKLGIIEPDLEKPTAVEAAGSEIAGGAATLVPPEVAGFDAAAYDTMAEDLAGLYTGAYLDQLIAENFRLLDEEEEDAAVLLLAIATLH